eukprot:1194357-Prorocentrum_minimum.AAC.1
MYRKELFGRLASPLSTVRLETWKENSYKSCAVVGNHGDLLKGEFGAEIDSAAAVIRLNDAPTM